jgi:hypothetical protein
MPPRPAPATPEPIELDSALLEPDLTPDTEPGVSIESARPPVETFEFRTGLLWRLRQLWSLVRPGARRSMHGTVAVLAWLGEHTIAAGARLGKRLAVLVEQLTPQPLTGRRLAVLAAGVFALGAVIALPFALASRDSPAPIAVERATRTPAPEPEIPVTPSVMPEVADTAEAPLAVDADPNEPVEEDSRSRAELARRMARVAFEAGNFKDGVSYFRVALRNHRRAGEDDLLIRYTLVAREHRAAAPSARRLLMELARDARGDLPAPWPKKVIGTRAGGELTGRR